ncbi:MAG TPA: hypothetical protein VF911_04575 [Thermoanaerobaculia bacterium]
MEKLDQRLVMFNPATWMHDQKDLWPIPLKQLCIPGSHDSGMSEIRSSTFGSNRCNTQTQSKGILGQLNDGIRYFDIRPMTTPDGGFSTAHYTSTVVGVQGSLGQSIESVISDVNSFLHDARELVILDVSHAYQYGTVTELTASMWTDFLEGFGGGLQRHLYAVAAATTTLPDLTLSSFINGPAGPRPAVVILVPDGVTIPARFANKGIYPSSVLSIFNSYSDTSSLKMMATAQIELMRQQAAAYFLLSWTLTQSPAQAVACALHRLLCQIPAAWARLLARWWRPTSIRQMADRANAQLPTYLYANVSRTAYPKIIYIDNVWSPDAAALAVAVNLLCVVPREKSPPPHR